jgi:hypothetical protein
MDGGPVEVDWDVTQIAAQPNDEGHVNVTWDWKVTARKLPVNTEIRVEEFGTRAVHATPVGEAEVKVERAPANDPTTDAQHS